MPNKNHYQWASLISALTVAVVAQIPLLDKVLPPTAIIWILVVTNIVSAVLPSLIKQSANAGANASDESTITTTTAASTVSTNPGQPGVGRKGE